VNAISLDSQGDVDPIIDDDGYVVLAADVFAFPCYLKKLPGVCVFFSNLDYSDTTL
jgi:hypothetical protein